MKCAVCGLPGHTVQQANWHGFPMADLGICCSRECTGLLWEAQAQVQAPGQLPLTPFEKWAVDDLARRFRARRAAREGRPFNEPELRSPAELEIERICLIRWGRLPEDLVQTSADPRP